MRPFPTSSDLKTLDESSRCTYSYIKPPVVLMNRLLVSLMYEFERLLESVHILSVTHSGLCAVFWCKLSYDHDEISSKWTMIYIYLKTAIEVFFKANIYHTDRLSEDCII